MSAKPQISAGRAASDRRSGAPLALALAGLAGARSESQLLDFLQDVAVRHFGATGAIILTRQPAVASAHRIARLTGSAASLAIEAGHPRIAERLDRGKPVVTDSPLIELPGIPVPADADRAALVPCSGPGSANAICAFWRTGARPPSRSALDRLRLLAATAGLVFDRQLADLEGRLLRAGLDNRIRNVLAVIRSVGTRSAERAASMDDFLLHFEGRIDAIGRSQIAAARTGEISFEDLLREELLAQTIQDDENVSLEGMDVPVTAEQAEALCLSIHELAVNAVKFGAFAAPSGSLAVRWWVESGGEALSLNIDWRESCGPHVSLEPPARAGFGLNYLEHALPFQLNAEVTIDFAPRGVRCQIGVPLHRAEGIRPRVMPDVSVRAPDRPPTGRIRPALESPGRD